jgi:excisionase family DNA binding protein
MQPDSTSSTDREHARPPHPDSDSDVWTASDIGRYLRLSKNSVYAMLARGEVPGQFRFGRSWRISRVAFLKSFHGDLEVFS